MKPRQAVPLSADRLHDGWPGPDGTRIRQARAKDTEVANMLLEAAGVRLVPALQTAIEDGTEGAALLDGLAGTRKTLQQSFAHKTAGHTGAESMSSTSLTLIAADDQDRPVGVLSVTAPATVIGKAVDAGYPGDRALALSLFIAKIHGLAVAEEARGQGIASVLMKRAWQVYHQLDYFLLYGSYETHRDLGAFYSRCGYAVHAPGEPVSLDRIALPFSVGVEESERIFARWRPRH
ncbi:GNAT family N-acetyltransferase [Streptomyces candidus]|uniref:Ribosomal protein S18 acetylase RimI-like enzyme n=1 Tax=Streptomyces candidus TaxID=67283 RepID=A0A7X0HP23_9ACTN|nr:GNAT family N-acetyltransferase [Streptomyces candidus]MBB6439984.1 ribosomal protein S18 acetylase RimI-like enzyme [Streptomyces candidus]GHH57472.1 N-acetyltransferase [Streptomyces candidus]